jgi:cell division transport system ATP-binding protein
VIRIGRDGAAVRSQARPLGSPPAPTDPAELRRAAVALRAVSKEYPNGRRALVDVDLLVPQGDFVFLVGPSGAGKSTLIRLLIRDELPTAGEVWVAGEEVTRMPRGRVPRLRRRVGVVFQDYRLLPDRSVRENVAFALEVTGAPGRLIRPTVERVLALVGLSAQAQQRPEQLSGGEQQRAAIARALVHAPRLLIADEPTGNLDPLISWEIVQLLLHINGMGTTVLVATHDANVVTALRRRVVGMEDGRIVRDEVGGYHPEY